MPGSSPVRCRPWAVGTSPARGGARASRTGRRARKCRKAFWTPTKAPEGSARGAQHTAWPVAHGALHGAPRGAVVSAARHRGARLAAQAGIGYATAAITAVTLLFGEILPKSLAVAQASSGVARGGMRMPIAASHGVHDVPEQDGEVLKRAATKDLTPVATFRAALLTPPLIS